jgi:hypothetical protein
VPLLPRFVLEGLAVAVFSFYAGLLLGSLAAVLARRSGSRP